MRAEDLRETFYRLSGHDRYEFQLEPARLLLEGHNVILVAPTGSGKTFTALLPFVHARLRGLPFADRLIYAVPLRTLASSLYAEGKECLSPLGISTAIQTGASPNDPYFQHDAIFTTIDQLLSAYLGVPVSLPPRVANIAGGALIGAYVVLDEFHLLEPEKALATALEMGNRLRGYLRVLLMTATAPPQVVDALARRLNATVVRPSAAELAAIPSQARKERRLVWQQGACTAANVLDQHQGRSIVIFNTVARAQSFYHQELKPEAKARGSRATLLLLHSRFLQTDRDCLERRVRELFGKTGQGNAILVATQVVEVGLDVSCENLHTELAPANALVQRAGRCARFENEQGMVHVYQPPTPAPYPADQVAETGALLSSRPIGAGTVTYTGELEMVEVVHGLRDRRAIAGVNPTERADRVTTSLLGNLRSAYRELVRHVPSINVVIHDRPEQLRTVREAFALPRSVLGGFVSKRDLQGQEAGTVWLGRYAEVGRDEEPYLVWTPAAAARDLQSVLWVALSPAIATYDLDLGLVLGRAGNYRSPGEAPGRPRTPGYTYYRESFADHALAVGRHCRILASRNRAGGMLLARRVGIPLDLLEDWLQAVGHLHDTGKLSRAWQEVAWVNQRRAAGHERPEPGNRLRFLAHTDTAGGQTGLSRLPPHAAEGAFAAGDVLVNMVGRAVPAEEDCWEAVRALASAIARHHGTYTGSLGDFRLDEAADEEVRSCLGPAGPVSNLLDQPGPAEREEFERHLTHPEESALGWPLYWFLVRQLRLADQESQATRHSCFKEVMP